MLHPDRLLGLTLATAFVAAAMPATPAASAADKGGKAQKAPAEKADDAAPSSDEPEAKRDGAKVLVLPYQAIYRSVPQKKLDTATGLLQKELDQIGGLAIVRGAVAKRSSG